MPEEFDEEGFVAGSFDPIKIYDAPMVALSQMFEGEASFRSIRDTFMDPAALSPAERDSYVSRLKESLGNNGLTNAVLDIALNPFVWFMFLTTPAGGQALKSGAKVFTGLAQKAVPEGGEYIKFVTGRFSALRTLGLLNAHQYGAGTPLSTVLHSAQSRFSQLTQQDVSSSQPLVSEMLTAISKKFGTVVKSLDANDAQAATATIDGEVVSLSEYLKKFNVYAHMHMSGMNKNLVRSRATIIQNMKVQFQSNGKTYNYNINATQHEKLEKFKGNILGLKTQLQAAKNIDDLDSASLFSSLITREAKKRVAYLKEELGLTEDVTFKTAFGTSPSRADKLPWVPGEAPLRVSTQRVDAPALDTLNVSGEWLKQEGFMPLLDHSRSMMKSRYVDLFGDADTFARTGEVIYDDSKLLRIFRSLSSDANSKTAEEISNVLHKELEGYVGGDGYKKIVAALIPDEKGRVKMTLGQFKNILQSVRRSGDDTENFMSRNVWSYVDIEGGNVVKRRTDSVRVSGKDRSASLSARLNERKLNDPVYDSDDLNILRKDYERLGASPADTRNVDRSWRKSVEYEQTAPLTAEGGRSQVMNLDYRTSFDRYLSQTRNDIVLHIDNVYDDHFIRRLVEDKPDEWVQMIKSAKPSERRKLEKALFTAPGSTLGNSRYDLLRYTTDTMATNLDAVGRKGGEHARDYVMGTLINRMRGAMPMRDMVSEYATMQAKDMASSMANSNAFKSIEKMGTIPSKFVKNLRQFGLSDVSDSSGSALGRGITSAFYVSHLGLNLGSAMLNLMQPLMYASTWMDPSSMVKAYGKGLKQYFGYIQERLKLGVRADSLLVDQLRAKHFRLSNVSTKARPEGVDLLDIRKTDFEMVDQQAYAVESALRDQGKGGTAFWLSEMPMKLFTHSEIFNRVVTGEAMFAQMQKAGRVGGIKAGLAGKPHTMVGGSRYADMEVTENVREMVQNTQFGSDLINSPELFQKTGFGIPWVRQFFTFPVRTLTAWTDTAPMVNQGRRTWGLTNFKTEGRFSAMAHDGMRMMGTGAIVYEVGKNLLDVDLSRGLPGQTLYESTIVGPLVLEPASTASYNLPLSPAFSVIMDAAKALTEDDKSLIGTVLPRFVPGGISLSRALNMAPRLAEKGGWLGGLQRESADWSAANADGNIPIYRSDGSLLEFRSAARTVLGGLGFSSYMFNDDKALNGFLVKNREGIIKGRRSYLDAILSNNLQKASQIKGEFEKRFKFPLSVTKMQVDKAIELREVPLKERMYSRMQPDYRPIVKPYLVERLDQMKARTAEELDMSPAQKARELPSTTSFDGFDPYSAVTE